MLSLKESVKHPKIYAFTLKDYKSKVWQGNRDGKGLLKIGFTTNDVPKRIKEALGVNLPELVEVETVWVEAAIREDGSAFTDHVVHKRLTDAGVYRYPNSEWFECTVDELKSVLKDIRSNTSSPANLNKKSDFSLRPEQEYAISVTEKYFKNNANAENPPHFLWNAKMRFGKTFATYKLAERLEWKRVLVLTYKPAVEQAWREDLATHKDFEDWRFKGKTDAPPDMNGSQPIVWFASFQDVLGKDENGQPKAKNLKIHDVTWDAVVIDEYHFGAWRDAARNLYIKDKDLGIEGDDSEKAELDAPDLDEGFMENLEELVKSDLKVRNYLYLSGTPFRALTQGEFLEDQVFNWTYSDEQKAKENWKNGDNPYSSLPKMHLLTYEMPDKLKEIALNNNSEFSLTEFFKTHKVDGVLEFIHKQEVQKWLDLLRGQDLSGLWANVANNQRPPLPFEDLNLLQALQHTIWYLPSVDACKAMKALLDEPHNVFYKDYTVIVAAGGQAGIGVKALPPVQSAITKIPQQSKTITLTCGKLLTGVTVPAWTGIFMLRELNSPEAYFQAAFRVQSPWISNIVDEQEGGTKQIVHKENCYVIDFAPNRALRQIVDYATRLTAQSKAERDDEKGIAEFMEFLPVLGFDGYSMNHLNASDVIDFLTRGVSASMLARRWNSPELVNLDLQAMQNLLANTELVKSLEQVETFREISNELTAMIASAKEVGKKKVTKEPLSDAEKKNKDEATKQRDNLKKKLRRFLTRIPAFMYLTDNREKNIPDIIQQDEPELFQKVTGLNVNDFKQLVNAGVFNDSKMNDAVWKFRTFEEPSLSYDGKEVNEILGGWTRRKDEKFARLIEHGVLNAGDLLEGSFDGRSFEAQISEDFGLIVEGIRYETPQQAAEAATGQAIEDAWTFWHKKSGNSLKDIESNLD